MDDQTNEVTQAEAEMPTAGPTNTTEPQKTGGSNWWPAVIGLIVLALIGAGVYWYTQQKQSPVATNTETPTDNTTAGSDEGPLLVDAGVTWLGTPQKMTTTPKVFASLEGFGDQPDFFKMGTDNGNNIILAEVYPEGPSTPTFMYFVQTGPGSYTFLPKNSPTAYGYTDHSYEGPVLATQVATDQSKSYASISSPVTLNIKGAALTFYPGDYSDSGMFSIIQKNLNAYPEAGHEALTVFAQTKYGTLYSYTINDNQVVGNTVFILKRQDGLADAYQTKLKFVTDDYVPQVIWTDGTKNKDTYRFDGFTGGCGIGGSYLNILNSGKMDGLVQTGTTSTGEPIYEPTDKNGALIKAGYALNNDGKYYDSTTGELTPISLSEYVTHHPILVYKDALSRLIVLTNQSYGIQAECGKPVVYLYPTKTEQVSVKVDAQITKSDPAYNNGWTVTAQPNGQLTNTDGKTYDSLFWEGLGHIYPQITGGTVVRQDQVQTTLQTQVTKLGLNQKEAADFMAFWLPKMPTTPYVRLTWFGTNQMNALAPLTISPKPDTMIRIFLDFAGLDKPVAMPAQNLSSVTRKGFTVVEWGGLLQK